MEDFLKTLKEGYITRENKRDKGQFKGYEYTVFETSKSINRVGITASVKPDTVKQPLLSIDKELNNNKLYKEDAKAFDSKQLVHYYFMIYEKKFKRKPGSWPSM